MGGNESWLAACRAKDQLQPEGYPRRIHNAACSRNIIIPVYFRMNEILMKIEKTPYPLENKLKPAKLLFMP